MSAPAAAAGTMHALRVLGYGPGDGVVAARLPLPEPQPGQVRVRVQAAGISFVDLLLARGGYQVRPTPPFVPGSEFAGVVDALGAGVAAPLAPGQVVCGSQQGAWADFLCADAARLHPVPAGCTLHEAAVLLVPFGTALYGLRERGQLQPGETLLVLGAAGGVGHAAVQVGRWLGARVLALASTEAKRAAAQAAGAHEVIDSGGDWKDRVKTLAGPAGVSVVFDPVGGDATDAAFRTLGWGGRHLVVGFAGGQIHALRCNLALVKGASLVGVDLRQAGEREPARIAAVQRDVLAAWAAGHLKPRIDAVLPVGRCAEAFARVQDRATVGRVLLDFTGDDA